MKVPSLYHHFRDRADILLAVVQYVAGAAVVASGSVPRSGLARAFRGLGHQLPAVLRLPQEHRPPCCCTTGHEICFRADTKPRHSSCIDRGGASGIPHSDSRWNGDLADRHGNLRDHEPFFDGGTIFRNVDLNTQSALAVAVDASG